MSTNQYEQLQQQLAEAYAQFAALKNILHSTQRQVAELESLNGITIGVFAELYALRDENAELKRKLTEREWQPIETAPEQGMFLVIGNDYGDVDEGQHYVIAFQLKGLIVDLAEDELKYVTHWMPLPPAPKQGD